MTDYIFLGSKIFGIDDYSREIKRCFLLGRKAMTNLENTLKNKDIALLMKICIDKAVVVQSYMWMWELNHKESWVLKNWCFQIVVLESPLDCKKIKPVSSKGNQPWVFTERTDAEAEAEAPILWSQDGKSWLTGKDPMLGKIEEKRRRGGRGWDG